LFVGSPFGYLLRLAYTSSTCTAIHCNTHCNTHCDTCCDTCCDTHCNTHCNTHGNTHCYTHCNTHCDTHGHTHGNTHGNTHGMKSDLQTRPMYMKTSIHRYTSIYLVIHPWSIYRDIHPSLSRHTSFSISIHPSLSLYILLYLNTSFSISIHPSLSLYILRAYTCIHLYCIHVHRSRSSDVLYSSTYISLY